jgi:hypothetical protein
LESLIGISGFWVRDGNQLVAEAENQDRKIRIRSDKFGGNIIKQLALGQ